MKVKMVFDINGKVGLVTGGASGIGLRYVKELLRNGAKGITIADLNAEWGKTALAEIEQEFGPNKAIFVKTDVTNKAEFEDAFKKTIQKYNQIDILFNNAGMLNDAIWEKQIQLNINAVIHGVLLGLENYLQKYRSGNEAVIVNISSVTGLKEFPILPIYTATKFAVHGMTRSWGSIEHYERTKVKVVGVCPGVTDTPLISEMSGKNLGEPYEALLRSTLEDLSTQKPEECAKGAIWVVKNAPSGTMWVVEGGENPYEYILPERETFKK